MLEGQVAVLSSGYLSASESAELPRYFAQKQPVPERPAQLHPLSGSATAPCFKQEQYPAGDAEGSALIQKLLVMATTAWWEKDVFTIITSTAASTTPKV